MLDLRGVDIKDPGIARLATMKSLRELNLADGRFTDKGLAKLADLPNLERLSLTRVRLKEEGIAVARGNPNAAIVDARLHSGDGQDSGIVEEFARH